MKKRITPKLNQSLPQESLPRQLELLDKEGYLDGEKVVQGYHFVNEIIEEKDLRGVEFSQCIFENCKLIHCDFSKTTISDCRFLSCDLSNANFTKTAIHRTEFIGSKLVGCIFGEGYLRNLLFQDCIANYCNMNESSQNSCNYINCSLKQASFVAATLVIEFKNCDLSEAYLFDTKLAGIDFSTSNIHKTVFYIEDIKGSIVSTEQAIELSKLLGIVVKE